MKKGDINTKGLKTVNNYAKGQGVTPQYIHKLVKEGKMDFYMVDGVKFVQEDIFPSLPVPFRRK